MGLYYSIQYTKGKENLATDALLRCQEEGSAATMIVAIPEWCMEVMDNYEGDEHIKGMLEKFALGNKEAKWYTMVDGLLRYKERIVLKELKLVEAFELLISVCCICSVISATCSCYLLCLKCY